MNEAQNDSVTDFNNNCLSPLSPFTPCFDEEEIDNVLISTPVAVRRMRQLLSCPTPPLLKSTVKPKACARVLTSSEKIEIMEEKQRQKLQKEQEKEKRKLEREKKKSGKALVFTKAEEKKYRRRLEEGYDVSSNQRHNVWLKQQRCTGIKRSI